MNGALAGLVLLIIGDSHIAAGNFFNNPLHNALMAQGATVHSYGVCSSTAEDWLRPLTLSCGGGERHGDQPVRRADNKAPLPWAIGKLIAQYHPDIMIVELGDTMADYPTAQTLPRETITNNVKLLTGAISARNVPCIWVGPSWGSEGGTYKKTFARVKELSELLSHTVSPCRYVDSLAFSQPGEWPTVDGVHLTAGSYSLWAGKLADAIIRIAPDLRKH
jgi:lysophospholipase L1-like esterase